MSANFDLWGSMINFWIFSDAISLTIMVRISWLICHPKYTALTASAGKATKRRGLVGRSWLD
jgi:hypothetical protein